jgi:tetratricopeptide (TPR) repeat protein
LSRTLTTHWQATERWRREAPPGGRVLLVGEARGALFERGGLALSQDGITAPLPLAAAVESVSPDAIARRFRQLGVTHVVLNEVSSEYYGRTALATYRWPPDALVRYRDFCARWLEPLPADPGRDNLNGGFVWYRVRRAPGARARSMKFLPGTEGLGARQPGEDKEQLIRRLRTLVEFTGHAGFFENRLGIWLVDAGRWAEAEPWLRAGIAAGFDDAPSWGDLGLALRGKGRNAEAAAAFARAAALDPAEPRHAQYRDECLALARRERGQ